MFQRDGYEYILWGINYSTFLPIRTCNDTNPIKTWTDINSLDAGMSIGCDNRVLSAAIVPSYILCTFCPILFQLRCRTALILALQESIVLAIGLLAVGTRIYITVAAVLFQLAAGLTAAHFCRIQTAASRRQFVLQKDIRAAAEQNRRLLFSILPPNVVGKLDRDDDGMVGALIPHCTVMFCTLEQAAELQVRAASVSAIPIGANSKPSSAQTPGSSTT
jgi:hypothetical protein